MMHVEKMKLLVLVISWPKKDKTIQLNSNIYEFYSYVVY